eukprot:10709393-Alexandrium_andersonii.AAC.1
MTSHPALVNSAPGVLSGAAVAYAFAPWVSRAKRDLLELLSSSFCATGHGERGHGEGRSGKQKHV